MKKLQDVLNKALEDPEFKKYYDEIKQEREIIEQIIEERKNQGLTQQQLAEKIGTKASNISRLETGNANPTVEFLLEIAKALNKKLKITLE